MKTDYKGFVIETHKKNDGSEDSFIFLNGEPVGGCSSHLDQIDSLQKAKNKIDDRLK